MSLCCIELYYYVEWHYAECHYAEYCYAKCRYAECRGANPNRSCAKYLQCNQVMPLNFQRKNEIIFYSVSKKFLMVIFNSSDCRRL